MSKQKQDEALDLIHKIALVASKKCEDPNPSILKEALEEIIALSRHKGGKELISRDRRRLFDLD